jgi:hypothetical protein
VRKPVGMGQLEKRSLTWEDCAESGLKKWDGSAWTAMFWAGIRRTGGEHF